MAGTRRRPTARDRNEVRVVLGNPTQLAGLRARLRRLLLACGQNRTDTEAIVLATQEAANNALLSCEAGPCRVEVSVSLIEQFVCIEVRDVGKGVRGVCLDPTRLASQEAEHGRGLHLMGELMESLELVPREHGTLVRMTKRLAWSDQQDAEVTGRLAC